MTGCVPRGAYPDEWADLANLVKDEAGRCCVRCGAPHDPSKGRTLTVHHFDGDKANSARWNLMALCQACHLSVQARVDPPQGLMTIRSVSTWALPYVAGCIEAGESPAPKDYDLAHARMLYTDAGLDWPAWAPCP